MRRFEARFLFALLLFAYPFARVWVDWRITDLYPVYVLCPVPRALVLGHPPKAEVWVEDARVQ